MDEYFLQFLWKFQKLEGKPLVLTNKEVLEVYHPGHQNFDSGPDFRDARLKIGELMWSGSVEIHYRSSDWKRHGHLDDQAYHNVVLHVVWNHDQDITIDGQPIPTLELARYAPKDLQAEYRRYINQPEDIRCGKVLHQVPNIQITTLLDRSLAARLEAKSQTVLTTLAACGNDWEETTYRTLAANFGFKTNKEAMLKLSTSLPYKVLRKHQQQPTQLFALLFGMSGWLNDTPTDDYSQALQREFQFLQKKYSLSPLLEKHLWKHARMRPANFPAVRLAQFGAVLHAHQQLFDAVTHIHSLKDAQSLLHQPLPDYWKEHMDLGKPATKPMTIGKSAISIIIINTVAPILAAYAQYIGEVSYLELAQELMESLPAERNKITKKWTELGISLESAADSQAALHQFQHFCQMKKCLHCNIGLTILHRK
ncbi:DUF2851 family protein [Marinoscillum furvescens]|uniref:Uncharacterized protein DUF2851 n=1 Tax=Marinoscillum furvescens DSM 4134 TaxID=1122208 RepID=A0A3D9LGM1_MARFU|nr:DUF2851 family protein [Marinoscillum furvescens]REE05767.1 uncharacterized protein DUF2851 [Marinoscillum furvescens DSM 4134]